MDIVIQTSPGFSAVIQTNNSPVEISDTSKIKFTWRGAWQPNLTYSREDVIRYQGSAYVCLVQHTSDVVFDASKWDVMVEGSLSAQDIHYVHNQTTASDLWVIDHNLGKFASCVVVDSSGEECEGNLNYTSQNQIVIQFSAPFSGRAYLN